LENAGLYFSKTFLLNYQVDTTDLASNKVNLKNTNTDNDIVIEYFDCTSSNVNKNCVQLTKDYSNAAGKTITTAA
jgi:hypothetical protein